jgi:hypothetical protein
MQMAVQKATEDTLAHMETSGLQVAIDVKLDTGTRITPEP